MVEIYTTYDLVVVRTSKIFVDIYNKRSRKFQIKYISRYLIKVYKFNTDIKLLILKIKWDSVNIQNFK